MAKSAGANVLKTRVSTPIKVNQDCGLANTSLMRSSGNEKKAQPTIDCQSNFSLSNPILKQNFTRIPIYSRSERITGNDVIKQIRTNFNKNPGLIIQRAPLSPSVSNPVRTKAEGAVRKFQANIKNRKLLDLGQYYRSNLLLLKIKQLYKSFINSKWLGDSIWEVPEKNYLRPKLKKLLDDSYENPGSKNNRKLRLRIWRYLYNKKKAARRLMRQYSPQTQSIKRHLFWLKINNCTKLQKLLRKFKRLEALTIYEGSACKEVASNVAKIWQKKRMRIAKLWRGKGMRSKSSTKAGYRIPMTKLWKSVTARAANKFAIVKYNKLKPIIDKMRKTLRSGYLIHARVLSGQYGPKKRAYEDHSIVILGYQDEGLDKTTFFYWNPAVAESKSLRGGVFGERGYGYLYYRKSMNCLTTAKSQSEFNVNSGGYHISDPKQKRYQVLRIWTEG